MTKPLLALNGTIFNSQNSGAKQRFVGLFRKVIEIENGFSYSIITDSTAALKENFHGLQGASFVESPLPADRPLSRYIKGLTYWNRKLNELKPQIFDNSHLPLIKNKFGATFLTIHDIRYLRNPELYSFFRGLIAPSVMRKSINNADVIITVSQAIKDEVLKVIEHPKVVVIPNGIDTPSMPIPDERDLTSLLRMGIKKPYLLSVGHFEKRKNFCALISAFKNILKSNNGYQLVLVGNPADDLKKIEALIEALDLKQSVILLKKINFGLIASLYKNCELFIFPSLYEGFGIPLLEALHYGARIVMSDIPVFREITNGKGIYFDPKNILDIQEKIELMINNSEIDSEFLSRRSEILRTYSYEASARKYIELMKAHC